MTDPNEINYAFMLRYRLSVMIFNQTKAQFVLNGPTLREAFAF